MLKKPRGTKNLISASHAYSKQQENSLAKSLSGKLTPGSGSQSIKGDVLVGDNVMLEAKCTQAKSYSLKLSNLREYKEQAIGQNRELVVQLDFIDPSGRKLDGFVVISDKYLQEILNIINKE